MTIEDLGVPVLPWTDDGGAPADEVDEYLVADVDGDGPVYVVAGSAARAEELAHLVAAQMMGTVGAVQGGESSRRQVWVVAVLPS